VSGSDEDVLKTQFRVLVLACAGVTAMPFALLFVSWVMMRSTEEASPQGADPILFVIFGILALSPLIAAPMLRRLSRRPDVVAAQKDPTPSGIVLSFWLAEYAVWEIPSLLGFVAYVMGAPALYFAACLVLSLVGYAITFPRWSGWIERIEALEERGSLSIISE